MSPRKAYSGSPTHHNVGEPFGAMNNQAQNMIHGKQKGTWEFSINLGGAATQTPKHDYPQYRNHKNGLLSQLFCSQCLHWHWLDEARFAKIFQAARGSAASVNNCKNIIGSISLCSPSSNSRP